MAYSYTLNEQEINPEGADLELNEYQISAVDLMQKALALCNRTTNGDRIFAVLKSEVDGSEGTSLPPLDETIPTERGFIESEVTDNNSGYYPQFTIKNNIEPSPTSFSVNPVDNSLPRDVKIEQSTSTESASQTIYIQTIFHIKIPLFLLVQYFVLVLR